MVACSLPITNLNPKLLKYKHDLYHNYHLHYLFNDTYYFLQVLCVCNIRTVIRENLAVKSLCRWCASTKIKHTKCFTVE